ncbi:glycosyltransferase [Nocardia sp. NPDC024068]|uniref:glycosyltransferase n=1 Tax=Nocardia sp. NPDC024068 TaxID=3157197 RepID=UPI0033DC4516
MSPVARNRCVRAVQVGSALAVAGAVLSAWNRCTVPRLSRTPPALTEAVTVCVPARDEARRLPALIGDLRAQTGIPLLRVLVLDDDSSDGTAEAARRAIDGDPRCAVLTTTGAPPPGWTGKAAACRVLAEHAFGTGPDTGRAPGVLVFLDADVRLAPAALAAAVTQLRARRLTLLTAWPRQRAHTLAELLVQPLLCWSWAATLPVALADRGTRPSTVVACGQFLVFDTSGYRAIGGHIPVAAAVTEDLALARALRRAGHRTAVAAAGELAATRMYCGAAELAGGYRRWLWSAYSGTVSGGLAVAGAAAWAYWLPPLAAVLGRGRIRRYGILGYVAAVSGRLLARDLETGRPPAATDLLSAAAHPLSVGAYLTLWGWSQLDRYRNALTWKGRPLSPLQELDSR